MSDDDSDSSHEIDTSELPPVDDHISLRTRLTTSRGGARVQGDECDALLDLLGLDSGAASLRQVGAKRACLLEALASRPGYVQAAFACRAWTAAGSHPAQALLAALPHASASARPDKFPSPTALPDLVVDGSSFSRASVDTGGTGHAPLPSPSGKKLPSASTRLSPSAVTAALASISGGGAAVTADMVSKIARLEAERLLQDINTGRSDMEIIPNQLTASQRARATEVTLHPCTRLADWRQDGTAEANLFPSPPTQQALRNCMFDSDMETQDKKRLLKGYPQPDIWSNPFSLSALDSAALGSRRCGVDKGWQERQAGLAKQLLPTLQSLSSAACVRDALFSPHVPDADRGDAVLRHLEELETQLSAAFHLCAFELTELEHKREDLLLQAYSTVDSLTMPRKQEAADWCKTAQAGDADQSILERAKVARAFAKDAHALAKNGNGKRPRKGREQGKDSCGGGGGNKLSKSAKRRRAKAR